jgi:hypothetical protein
MKTFLKVILILLLIVVLLVGAVLGAVEWCLRSDSVKQLVRKGIHDEQGLHVKDFTISLFRGVSLEGLVVTNRPDIAFVADSVAVRHRIFPLFRRRIEIAEIALKKPSLTVPLAASLIPADVASNPNVLGAPAPLRRNGWEFALDKFSLRDGSVTLLNASNKPAARLDGVRLDLTPPKSSGAFHAKSLQIGPVTVRDLDAPLKKTATGGEAAPLRGSIAGGTLSGAIIAASPITNIRLDVRDADVPEMFRQSNVPAVLGGKLRATAALEIGGSLNGAGKVEVVGATTAGLPLMGLLSVLLKEPSLRELKLDECRMEFNIVTNEMRTPVIRLVSPQVELTGSGAVSLPDGALNHDMTLVVSPELAARAPESIRKAFTARPDGRSAISFHVAGTYNAPKVDLEDRVLRGVAEKALGRLQRFLR